MRCIICAHVALLFGAVLAPAASAAGEGDQAVEALFIDDSGGSDAEQAAALGDADSDVELVQFSSRVGSALGGSNCQGQWFVGAEYLSVRANFSQATAFVTTDLTTNPPTITYNEFDFNYGDSYRIYGGYRVPDCGCEVRFAFTSFDSDGSFQSPPVPTGGGVSITSPLEVVTGGPGDTLSGTASVEIDDYDLGFARTIPLGSQLGCCPDPCACWCPAWDITWSGGLRVSDVESQLNYASNIVSTAAPIDRVGSSRVSFQGVGLRTGLAGRRYFGRSGIASLYVKGDISLLLGDVEYSAVGDAFSLHQITSTQVVPITEIEAGGTVFLTQNATVTAGYLLSAWHDLGHRAEYLYPPSTGVQINSLDDANLLTLDGWFVRAEIAF